MTWLVLSVSIVAWILLLLYVLALVSRNDATEPTPPYEARHRRQP